MKKVIIVLSCMTALSCASNKVEETRSPAQTGNVGTFVTEAQATKNITISDSTEKMKNVPVEEIINRGYKIKAEVITELGYVIPEKALYLKLSENCYLKLLNASDKGRILKKGRVFYFDKYKLEEQATHSQRDDEILLTAQNDKTIFGMYCSEYSLSQAASFTYNPNYLEQYSGLKVYIEPNSNLDEASSNNEKDNY